MFKSETLFILGAGSSYPYGYPLGKELVKHIIDNIKSDQILIPLLQNLRTKYYTSIPRLIRLRHILGYIFMLSLFQSFSTFIDQQC